MRSPALRAGLNGRPQARGAIGIVGNSASIFGLVGRGRLRLVDDVGSAATLVLAEALGKPDLDVAIRIQNGATLASAYTATDFIL